MERKAAQQNKAQAGQQSWGRNAKLSIATECVILGFIFNNKIQLVSSL